MNNELFGLGRTWWFGLLVVVGATLLVILGHIDKEMWKEIVLWIAGIVVGGKTVEKAADALGGKRK